MKIYKNSMPKQIVVDHMLGRLATSTIELIIVICLRIWPEPE